MEKSARIYFILLIILGISLPGRSAICTAIASGDWNDPAIWSCGAVPSCGDNIEIPTGIIVDVNTQVDLDENSSPACSTATYMVVFGTLRFTAGFKISLACGSVVEIMPGGAMINGGGGGSSNWLMICQVVEWESSDGPVSGYARFGDFMPLASELKSFSIFKHQDKFEFIWVLSSELDNQYFTIEESIDGFKWNVIGQVASYGDHSDEQMYSLLAFSSFKNENAIYFRLLQSDINGNRTVLDVKSFENEGLEITAYPNPLRTGQELTVRLESSEQYISNLVFYNSQGQIVQLETVQLDYGMNSLIVNPDKLEKGIYFISLPELSESGRFKLIIE